MASSKFRTVGTISIVILFIGVIIQVLYDPISSIKHSLKISHARAEFPQARIKWETSGIVNYAFEIQGGARSICQPSALIEVRNNVVVKVETKDLTSDISPVIR